jgi:hypothetical protein
MNNTNLNRQRNVMSNHCKRHNHNKQTDLIKYLHIALFIPPPLSWSKRMLEPAGDPSDYIRTKKQQ